TCVGCAGGPLVPAFWPHIQGTELADGHGSECRLTGVVECHDIDCLSAVAAASPLSAGHGADDVQQLCSHDGTYSGWSWRDRGGFCCRTGKPVACAPGACGGIDVSGCVPVDTAEHCIARDVGPRGVQEMESVMILTMLTVNIHKGFSLLNRHFVLKELRNALLEARPDLVFLQEVTGAHTVHASRLAEWPTQSHYEYLADTVWSDFAYGRNAVYPEGHHGNAVLSRYPIVASANHDISIAGPEPRGLLHCLIQPPALPSPFHAICVHLGLNARHRQIQLHGLCSLIDSEVPDDAPLLVAGDFNDWRQHADPILARCGMQEIH